MENNLNEAFFYNAVNVALESDYGKIKKARDKFGSWSKAWNGLRGGHIRECNPEKEWNKISSAGAKLILREEPEFPELLKELPDPPFGIYIMGAWPGENMLNIAVIGTRKSTAEGKNAAKQFARKLSENGAAIVSGLALGIDAAAHEGCLEVGGKTIAVLGCGIGRFYPSTNEILAKKIIEKGGAVISEYPPESPPLPYRFLERNRIVSGVSKGVVVIEAPERSGSLVTARLAMEQNRDVFVLPGNVSHPNYRGSNQLIRNGAELVTKPEEILETYGIEQNAKKTTAATADSEEESLIIGALKKFSEAATADKIGELTGIEVAGVNRSLTVMIMKNIVEETSGKYKIR